MTIKTSHEKRLEKDGSVSVHHTKIQALATEVYKVKSGYTTKFFSDLFNKREISPYNLRTHSEIRVTLTRTVYHGSEIILHLGPKIWDILPTSLKEAVSLSSFKKLIKKF